MPALAEAIDVVRSVIAVVFSISPNKKEDALRLGADEVVISKNADEMAKHAGSFGFILDCVAANHDINAYINLLTHDGNITMVGAPDKPLSVNVFGLIFDRRRFSGSPIGELAETQEMLDFCGAYNITADVEVPSRRSTKPTIASPRSTRSTAFRST